MTSHDFIGAQRKYKAKRAGAVFYAKRGLQREMNVKDTVLQAYENATKYMPDIEARAIARQLSIAFSDAAEAMDD